METVSWPRYIVLSALQGRSSRALPHQAMIHSNSGQIMMCDYVALISWYVQSRHLTRERTLSADYVLRLNTSPLPCWESKQLGFCCLTALKGQFLLSVVYLYDSASQDCRPSLILRNLAAFRESFVSSAIRRTTPLLPTSVPNQSLSCMARCTSDWCVFMTHVDNASTLLMGTIVLSAMLELQ